MKLWDGGFLYGFFFKKGLYNSNPINDYIDDWFDDRLPVEHISIGVTNLLTGAFETHSEHLNVDDFNLLIKASFAHSGVTPAIEAMDGLYLTGSSVYENDVTAAINHCEALGYNEEDIVIDTVLSGAISINEIENEKSIKQGNAFAVMRRSGIMWKYYS